jgi:hypothetical protein
VKNAYFGVFWGFKEIKRLIIKEPLFLTANTGIYCVLIGFVWVMGYVAGLMHHYLKLI